MIRIRCTAVAACILFACSGCADDGGPTEPGMTTAARSRATVVAADSTKGDAGWGGSGHYDLGAVPDSVIAEDGGGWGGSGH